MTAPAPIVSSVSASIPRGVIEADRVSDASPETYRRLVSEHAATGLWPVRAVDFESIGLVAPHRRHELWHDPEHLISIRGLFGLDRIGPYEIGEDAYCFRCGPVRDRTGELAMASAARDIDMLLEILDREPPMMIGGEVYWRGSSHAPISMVPARRPADALESIGWGGAANGWWGPADSAIVLRSWEERLGAYLFSAGRSTMELVVTRPPQTIDQARMLAEELLHYCPYDTQLHGYGGIEPYARSLLDSHWWRFWWD